MSASDLDAEITKKEKEISAAESNFKVPPVLFRLHHCSSVRQPACPLACACLPACCGLMTFVGCVDAVRPPLVCVGDHGRRWCVWVMLVLSARALIHTPRPILRNKPF
jgi:hypothetical protein